MVVEPTHLKNMLVKLETFPKVRGENFKKNIWNHQPVMLCWCIPLASAVSSRTAKCREVLDTIAAKRYSNQIGHAASKILFHFMSLVMLVAMVPLIWILNKADEELKSTSSSTHARQIGSIPPEEANNTNYHHCIEITTYTYQNISNTPDYTTLLLKRTFEIVGKKPHCPSKKKTTNPF